MSQNNLFFQQMHAGYILDCVKKVVSTMQETSSKLDWEDVWRSNACFDVISSMPMNEDKTDPLVAVAENIVSRGFPTRAPYTIEEHYANQYDFIKTTKNEIGGVSSKFFEINNQVLERAVTNASVLCDPHFGGREFRNAGYYYIDGDNVAYIEPSQGERAFVSQKLFQHLGVEIDLLFQFLEPQRTLSSILNFAGKRSKDLSRIERRLLDGQLLDSIEDFYAQRVDFSIHFPAATKEYEGYDALVVEVDGAHHQEEEQKHLDAIRDAQLDRVGWAPTIRTPGDPKAQLTENMLNAIKAFLGHPYFQQAKERFTETSAVSEEELALQDVIWGPLAVARVQRLLLRAIQSHFLSFSADEWYIAFVSPDNPQWFKLGVVETLRLLHDLFQITNETEILTCFPKVIVEVKGENGQNFKWNITLHGEIEEIHDTVVERQPDVAVEFSLLHRRYVFSPEKQYTIYPHAGAYIWSYTSYAQISQPRIVAGNRIEYPPFMEYKEDEAKYIVTDDQTISALKRILRDIFRKDSFRSKQLEAINLALQQKNVIALLPTGAGKSLIFQLAAFLQPGVTIVVEPLKSLMADQIQNLQEASIHVAREISSNLDAQERQKALKNFADGQFLLFYLAPERFQMAEFRSILKVMNQESGIFAHYCVIDEAHCVSEWGHDFRTPYLRLGENARTHLQTSDGQPITMLALTGTASYDVLADIQRELNIENQLAVITPETFRRDELSFYVRSIPPVEGPYMQRGIERQKFCSQVLREIPSLLSAGGNISEYLQNTGDDANAGIIFCPHARGKMGVNSTDYSAGYYSLLCNEFRTIAKHVGKFTGQNESADNERNQKEFKKNQINLLVATKAFGMGVDKPNIRFTVHVCLPGSIEAFYQEAGRAGRDKKPSACLLLYEKGTDGKPMPDLAVQEYFFEKAFPSWDEDFQKCWNVFNMKSFTIGRVIFDLRRSLEEAYGISSKLNREMDSLTVQWWDKEQRRYITCGKIIFDSELSLQVNYYRDTLMDEQKRLILEFLQNEINSIRRDNNTRTINELFDEYKVKAVNDSMAEAVEKLKDKEQRWYTVSFEGSAVSLFAYKLLERWTKRHGRRTYPSQREFSEIRDHIIKIDEDLRRNIKKRNVDTFVQLVTEWLTKHSKKFFDGHDFDAQKLKNVFYNILDEGDTFKAIYRLSLAGVISDYEVNYRSKLIRVKLQRLAPREYAERVRRYLLRYESLTYVNGIQTLKMIALAQTDTQAIQLSLQTLINFTYEKIASKRRAQIDVMERTIANSLSELKSGSSMFEEEIYNYFEAKYVLTLRESVCSKEEELTYELVVYWLNDRLKNDNTGAYLDNISHLRGSCNRLVADYPENPILYLLRSFSILVNTALEQRYGIEDYRKGWQLLQRQLGLSQEETTAFMRIFNQRILEDVRPELKIEFNALLDREIDRLGLFKIKAILEPLYSEVSRLNRRVWG